MIFLEIEMEADYSQTTSTVNATDTSAQSKRTTLITVGEAAQRLGVSKSTAYRINRKSGPFLFASVGRRVYIDRVSFEIHAAGLRGIERQTEVGTDKGLPEAQDQDVEATAGSQPSGRPPKPPDFVAAISSILELNRSGQRELIIRPRNGLGILSYLA
jgi:excisionase family DNA binding protein